LSLPPKEVIFTFTDELVVNGSSTKETKRPLVSFITHFKRGRRRRRRLAVKATIAECSLTVVLPSPEAQTRRLKWRETRPERKKEGKKERSQEISRFKEVSLDSPPPPPPAEGVSGWGEPTADSLQRTHAGGGEGSERY